MPAISTLKTNKSIYPINGRYISRHAIALAVKNEDFEAMGHVRRWDVQGLKLRSDCFKMRCAINELRESANSSI